MNKLNCYEIIVSLNLYKVKSLPENFQLKTLIKDFKLILIKLLCTQSFI